MKTEKKVQSNSFELKSIDEKLKIIHEVLGKKYKKTRKFKNPVKKKGTIQFKLTEILNQELESKDSTFLRLKQENKYFNLIEHDFKKFGIYTFVYTYIPNV